jgi:uncharacterized caspase-like protein
MTTRRHFLGTLASLPAISAVAHIQAAWAATADPSRVAMVIGNSAYQDAPLTNPRNDAGAMKDLLSRAGFTVDAYLDLNRAAMTSAFEKLGALARRPETRQILFYYAGHGVQLDWRNYLLPVDANAKSSDQIRQSCVELGSLLNELGKARDKTFVLILDACRDNPFGAAYKPERAGLAQFDAPVGSLLAYATSPGKGAADEGGSGKNGLYTEHLLRELAVRGTRIEDALKRVRLNVRLASQGLQIPWESTSLESDVFLFEEARQEASEADALKEVDAELAVWNRIKSSQKLDDWAGYVRTYPNGRFAEIAQAKVAVLQSEAGPSKRPATTPPAAGVPAGSSRVPVIDIKAGAAVPTALQRPGNPFSAGSFPLGRKYTEGDESVFVETNLLTGSKERRTITVKEAGGLITLVDEPPPRDPNERSLGATRERSVIVVDTMGNTLSRETINLNVGDLVTRMTFDAPLQFAPEFLQVGRKWRAATVARRVVTGPIRSSGVETKSQQSFDLRIVRREKISVPAGTFDAFRLDISGVGSDASSTFAIERTHWLVPGLNALVRSDSMVIANGEVLAHNRSELISTRQATTAS